MLDDPGENLSAYLGAPFSCKTPRELLRDGLVFAVGSLEVEVLATPGHSPGSLTFYVPELKAAFVGDLVFRQSVGRTDFPGGSSVVLVKSVKEHIFTLPPDTVLYSGHGPKTSVAEEMRKNPYIPKD